MKVPALSRREREVLDILYRRGRISARRVQRELRDPPSYSSVRTLLRILEEKGHVRHEVDGQTYLFSPVIEKAQARRGALRHLVDTFFDGSGRQLVATLLDSENPPGSAELDQIAQLIEAAKRRER